MTDKITEWQHISVGPPSTKASIADLQSMLDVANLKAGKPVFIGATVNGVEHVMIPKALYDEWVAANDAALDWADANARAFPIETAPRDQKILLWNDLFNTWVGAWWSEGDENPKLTSMLDMDVKFSKFWRPEPPTPSNPPLPEPLEALGAVLRRVKGTA